MDNRAKVMTFIVLLSLILTVGMGLVSYNKKQSPSISTMDKRLEKLQKENEALTVKKEQLEEERSELIQEAEKSSETASSVEKETDPGQEELKQFITDYLKAVFTYTSNADRNKGVRPYVSDKYFEFLMQYNSDTPAQSTFIDSEIYTVSEAGGRAVARLTYSYGMGDALPNKYDMIVSVSISKNSAGAYQIDSQENQSVQYQTQKKEW